MTYISILIASYIVLGVLDLLAKRNHKTTRSLKKFTVRTVVDVAFIGAIGAAFWIAILVWGTVSEDEVFYSQRGLTVIIPLSVIWLGITFFAMIAPVKGVWDIIVDNDDIIVVKAWLFRKCWKISDVSYCKIKRGGMNVYVKDRKRKAFFIDGMTDHYNNFVKRMEKEGKKFLYSKQKP